VEGVEEVVVRSALEARRVAADVARRGGAQRGVGAAGVERDGRDAAGVDAASCGV
jgi:hypothetical protein